MNETDWNTPRNGDFVRYVEQLTARSLQRVHAHPERPGVVRPPAPAGSAPPAAAVSSGVPAAPGSAAPPDKAAGYAVAGLVGLLVLWAAGAPLGVLVLLAALGAGLFKRLARRDAPTSAARQLLTGLRQGLQNKAPKPPAGGATARHNPRKQQSP